MTNRPGVGHALLPSLLLVAGAHGATVRDLVATGHDSRIDLRWQVSATDEILGFDIHRSQDGGKTFQKVNTEPHGRHVYSDFIGANGQAFHYRVSAALKRSGAGPLSGQPPCGLGPRAK